ncbi:hypothetical protein BJ508DRAFT_410617 [Ascobolus immersus RN42]|uniref:Uncharacterized protein n=1 Tax=Ascobolus immersus RN42 TaxID=1160509 RepID=A0A3N4ILN0_ASCIM|nr:hypothetical protein BJ508DRAFT_410617 [Ascobolus immersus RN42]
MVRTINTLVSTFAGLPDLAFAVSDSTTIASLHAEILHRLPINNPSARLLLSTVGGSYLSHTSDNTLDALISDNDTFISLRLVPALVGGKGGFGSQLRAAGGRMSSKKKRNGEENNDSCRNLDGRRIRTVKEAKALAAYLEIKPDMERKEKELRKERWRAIVEQAEKRELEQEGKEVPGGKRFDDIRWLEQTEEDKEKTREAVLKAMKDGVFKKDNSSTDSDEEDDDDEMEDGATSSTGTSPPSSFVTKPAAKPRRFLGFDEDDEFMSSDDEAEETKPAAKKMEVVKEVEEVEEEKPAPRVTRGRGKGKAKA